MTLVLVVMAVALVVALANWKTIRQLFSSSGFWDRSTRAMIGRVVGNHRKPKPRVKRGDLETAVSWARELLAMPEGFVILDTETTGIDESSEVLQVGIIDGAGTVLLDSLVKPTNRKRWPKAQGIHNISPQMVEDAPGFGAVRGQIQAAIGTRLVIIYNAKFDVQALTRSAEFAGCTPPKFNVTCAMTMQSLFKNEWDHSRGHYRWHKLKGGDHSAVGDCQATLRLIQDMAK